ncbi:MAG: YdcF family protein [Burkholderiaceae bacterium]|nr:MAG: YdcF family protein [Burkholderiaceae bacterium]
MNLPLSFLLKKILSALLLPPFLPWLLVIVGLLFLRWRPWLGRCLTALGIVLGIALSLPLVVGPMTAPLEKFVVPDHATLASAQAIVILGGGMTPNAPEYGGATVGYRTLERVRYGARLARELKLPVLVTGGAPQKHEAEADVMAATLKDDYGIAPRWVENESLDTRQNARYSHVLLRKAGIHRIVLVTHAAHMRRAVNEFEATGLEVIPAPTAFFTGSDEKELTLGTFLPSATTSYVGWYALHEWLGLLAQRLIEP